METICSVHFNFLNLDHFHSNFFNFLKFVKFIRFSSSFSSPVAWSLLVVAPDVDGDVQISTERNKYQGGDGCRRVSRNDRISPVDLMERWKDLEKIKKEFRG